MESLENDSSCRDEKTLSKLKALLVETYVTDARLGRPSCFKPEKNELKHYRVYNSWFLRLGLYIAVLVDLLLVLFEKPAIPGFSVPYWGTMLIELACLSYFVIRVVHGSLFTPDRKKYWKDIKNIAVITLVVVTVLDMFIYIILYNSCCASSVVRGTRVLRPLFVVNLNDFRQIRKAFRNIRKTLPDIISVLILLLLAIALFSLLGYMLFKDR
jgi:two pore calcium channel protein 3